MAPISITLSTRDPDTKGDRGRSQSVISLIVICYTRVVGAVSVVRVSTEHSRGQEAALHNPHWRLASFPRLPSEMQNRRTILPKVFRHLSGESNDGRAACKLCALHQPFRYQLYPETTTPNICLCVSGDMIRSIVGGDNSGDSNPISVISANYSIRTLSEHCYGLGPPVSTLETGTKKVDTKRIYVCQNFSRTFVNYVLAAAN